MKTEGEARTQEKYRRGLAKSCVCLLYSLEEIPVVQYTPEVITCVSACLEDISIANAVQFKACGRPGKLTAIENCN
jgi:hypothetical protein